MTKKAKPLVLFAGLPVVLRNLRGAKSVREVAEGAELAKEHLALPWDSRAPQADFGLSRRRE
jgi:hypothetical protein